MTKSLSEQNAEFFNSKGEEIFKQGWVLHGLHQISSFLTSHLSTWGVPTNGESFKLLDYACGPGVISTTLGSHATKIRGVDVSPKMIELYNAAAEKAGLSTDQLHGVVGDLLESAIGIDDDFDLAVISMALHHVSEPAKMVDKLFGRVRDGGRVLVVDFLAENGGEDLPEGFPIHHHGFSQAEIEEMFGKAGAKVEFMLHGEKTPVPVGKGEDKQIFFAVGTK